jgi:UDP-N-acetylmuramoyl-L-alanyl-D-glutamate--2,6-diaminopimelate ligase
MQMTLSQLVGSDALVPSAISEIAVKGITSDSRLIEPGFVFAALPGAKVDGQKFIADALQRGATAVISAGIGTSSNHIHVENPRQVLSHMAARFYGKQPETIVAVTGTNGKTSVSVFVRQIWEAMGFRAASLGTIGVVGPNGSQYLQHTTPDPVQLHALIAQLRVDHVKHLAVEASSHGLSQYRLDGLHMAAGAFTNLTQDHLDYHANLEDYFEAKMRLFDELLPQGAAAVINTDSPYGAEVLARAKARGLVTLGVGRAGHEIRLLDVRRESHEQHLTLETPDGRRSITLPLVGEFQISNALVAAGLVIATGGEARLAMHALQSMKGAPGRLEMVGRSESGASAFVDYAHTPDALESAISALRPFATGKLVVVFGCGGDRDRAKRSLMGGIAVRLADRVIVTDDNPRSESAAQIRKDILAAAKGATEIADRAEAIRGGVEGLQFGDILLVAGKGHEPGQIVGEHTLPFLDRDAVLSALAGMDYHG